MIQLYEGGAYLINGSELVPEGGDCETILKSKTGSAITKEEAA